MSRDTFQLQNCTALRCFWGKEGGIVGKREHATKIPQRYCPTYTDISRNWPQIRQPGEAPVFPCSTGGAQAEKQKGHTEIRILRLRVSSTLGGVQGTAVPCSGCLWAARAAVRNDAAAPQESTGRAGSCLRHCREPIRDLRLQAARLQHLPEQLLRSQPAVGSPAATWPRPAQLSSAGQMGPVPAGAAFPQQHSLEGIPKALGSQGQGEKYSQHQLLLHHFSLFTEPPS